MKYALISPYEIIYDNNKNPIGKRIAYVANDKFSIAPPLFWVSVNDTVKQDIYYWNGTNAVLKPIVPPNVPKVVNTSNSNTGPTLVTSINTSNTNASPTPVTQSNNAVGNTGPTLITTVNTSNTKAGST